jgi:hypothetical protein
VRLESLGGAVLPLKVNVGARVGGSTFAAVLHMAKAREEQTLVLRL